MTVSELSVSGACLDIGVHTEPDGGKPGVSLRVHRTSGGWRHGAGGLDRRGQAAIIRPLGSADSPPGARLWFWVPALW